MQPEIPSALQTAAQTLCDSLRASELFLRYQKARSRLDADPGARDLLDRLSEAQAGVRQRQANGGVTQSDIDTLRELQSRAQDDPAVMEFSGSQQGAIYFLQEINAEITELLGINFASLAKHSTC
jgi:cell fate (sporulation/competence/biofilm development) regulator YlbF (YheA/YmcA/DUF963 family)